MIFPSECYENFPMAISEAYSLGVPVVAAEMGSVCEIVEEAKTGLLFEPGDAAGLKEKIVYLMKNHSLLEEMGHNAYNYAVLHFSEESGYKKLIEIYEKEKNR